MPWRRSASFMRQCSRSDGDVGVLSAVRRSCSRPTQTSDISGRDLLPPVVPSELDHLAEGFAVRQAV
jgi:hypothetical protein